MGNQDQIQQVYAVSAARLVAQLFAVTGDYGAAQDAVREAFVRALARPGRLRQVDKPEAWLRTVALNAARSQHRRRVLFDRMVQSGRARSAGQRADHVALVQALQGLPRAIRETVVLHHTSGICRWPRWPTLTEQPSACGE